jgi:hypothetical protein
LQCSMWASIGARRLTGRTPPTTSSIPTTLTAWRFASEYPLPPPPPLLLLHPCFTDLFSSVQRRRVSEGGDRRVPEPRFFPPRQRSSHDPAGVSFHRRQPLTLRGDLDLGGDVTRSISGVLRLPSRRACGQTDIFIHASSCLLLPSCHGFFSFII